MKVTWNSLKAKANLKKHGVTFEEAATVLQGEYEVEQDLSAGEERFQALGLSKKLKVLMVVFCYRQEDEIRIISARRATKKEKQKWLSEK